MHDVGDPVAAMETIDGFINGAAMSQAMAVAAELRIPDLLTTGPKSAGELSRAAACHARSLHRLLRALAAANLCVEHDDGTFSLTAAGALLRTDAPGSMRHWAIRWGRDLWLEWGNLRHSVRTGETARRLFKQTDGLDHLERDAAAATSFNRSMAELTRRVARGVAGCYDFSGMKRLVDVGGGHGELLGAILVACPALRGVLFDRPHAMDGARAHLENLGVAARCETATGSFFDSVPAGEDGYLLKSVIHDWDDERSAVILRNCRKAIAGDGKLLLVEQIMPDRMEPSVLHQDVTRRDLTMLIGPGGQERTTGEFRSLLETGGFALRRTVRGPLNFFVIEAVPL